jgi:hypothetical protein
LREIAIFSKKIAEKIGRFLGNFLGKNCDFFLKNRQKLAGHWQKIVCLKKFRKPQGGGGMMCFGVQRKVILPY